MKHAGEKKQLSNFTMGVVKVIHLLFRQETPVFVPIICDALRDLVLFLQFKNPKKHPWRSVNFGKVVGFSLHS